MRVKGLRGSGLSVLGWLSKLKRFEGFRGSLRGLCMGFFQDSGGFIVCGFGIGIWGWLLSRG